MPNTIGPEVSELFLQVWQHLRNDGTTFISPNFFRIFFFMFILLMHILPLLALDNDRFYAIEQADDFPISFWNFSFWSPLSRIAIFLFSIHHILPKIIEDMSVTSIQSSTRIGC